MKQKIPQYLSLSYPYQAMERPNCRKYIIDLIHLHKIPIKDLANGFYFDKDGRKVFLSDGLKIQARKMMRERLIIKKMEFHNRQRQENEI